VRRPCPAPRCPNLEPCPEHARRAWQTSTRAARLPANWRKLTRIVKARAHATCERCGRPAPDGECDHVQRGDDHRLDNLQWLCRTCHRTKTLAEARQART